MSKEDKIAHFGKFNFDKDERWTTYFQKVEIPTGNVSEMTTKLKAKWYKKYEDPDFDPEWVVGPKATPTKPNFSYTPPPGATPTPPPTTARSSYTPPPQAYWTPPGQPANATQARRLFMVHSLLLFLGIFAVIPFAPFHRQAYYYFLRLTLLGFGYKLYVSFGMPSFRPMRSALDWLQRVLPTTEAFHMMVALTFMSQAPMVLVALPIWVLALYHASAYAASHMASSPLWQQRGKPLHDQLVARQPDALLLNAACEVAVGFLLVVQLVTPARNLLTLLFYWNMMKLRYNLPQSAEQHRKIWAFIGSRTRPLRQRMPFLEAPLGYAIRWFQTMPQ